MSNKDVEQLFKVLMQAKESVIIAGKTGAGKTELQKLLVGYTKDNDKIVLIEDTMDSHIKALYPEKDIVSLRTMTEDTRENKITTGMLNKAALRNNPDWIIVAESRGSEVYDMLQSAMTDHSIITTIHAKGTKMIPSRIISMIADEKQVNELLLGQSIVDSLRWGTYMGIEETDQGYNRFIRELAEYTDFTEKGVECNMIYEIRTEYDEKTKQYIDKPYYGKLSAKTISTLKFHKLFHIVPKMFVEDGVN